MPKLALLSTSFNYEKPRISPVVLPRVSGIFNDILSNGTKLTLTRDYVVRPENLKQDIEHILDTRAFDVESGVFVIMCNLECMVELLKQVHNILVMYTWISNKWMD